MGSLAPANRPSDIVSSFLKSSVDISSSSLTMPDNFQNPLYLGNSGSPQLLLPVESNAASLTGSICNFSRVSAPAVSSECLLPPASGTPFQPHMGSAYLYQYSSTTMLSTGAGQSQISTSATSNSGSFQWAVTGGSEKKSSSLRDFTLTVIDQDTAVSSMSMASQYDTTSNANNMASLYPSLSARLVQVAPSQIPNQKYSLSLPYQGGSQVYYYNQGTQGPLLSGELSPYLQSYGSIVSYTESRASVPQPELVMVLKEVQSTSVIPPASTSGIYYSVPAQPITNTSFQVMEGSLGMETPLGLQPPSQTFCLPQVPEFRKSCSSRNIQILESHPPPELSNMSMLAPVQSTSNLLALPPVPSQEQKENKNMYNSKANLSKPLETYQIPIENQDPPLLPLEIPDIHQLLASIDPLVSETPHQLLAGIDPLVSETPHQLLAGIDPLVSETPHQLLDSIDPLVPETPHQLLASIDPLVSETPHQLLAGIDPLVSETPHQLLASIDPLVSEMPHQLLASIDPLVSETHHQLLDSIDPLVSEMQPDCEKDDLVKNSLSLNNSNKNREMLEYGIESYDGFADITTLVEDIHLPQVLNSLDDVDQSKGPKEITTQDTRANQLNKVQENSSIIKAPDEARKNKHKASEPISGAPKAKIKPKSPDCVCLGEVGIGGASTSGRAPANAVKHSESKPQKAAYSRNNKTKSHRQEKTKKNKDNNSKKAEKSKQSENKVKAEEKPTIPKMKRRKNQPELIQENFKKPRTCLGMHMLESVQVFHALGKKPDKKTEPFSSRTLGNSSNTKDPQPPAPTKRWLNTLREGKGPEKTQVEQQKTDGSAGKKCSSPSQYELPPPGKVKLIPLPFLNLDKPQARPVPRRPQPLASRQPAVANTAQPGSNSVQPTAVHSSQPTASSVTDPAKLAQSISKSPSRPGSTNPAQSDCNSAQPTTVNSSQLTPTSSTGPSKPACSLSTNPSIPGLTNTTCTNVPHSAAPKPMPYETSASTSFQREPICPAVTKPQSPPKPQNRYLLHDFALQPTPWRKPNISGPVLSKPITKEQRPEREAMKRKAQLERENAAKYTSLGKVQYFIEREKEMEISDYYGYAM